ncbi:MAG: hypothetical protein HKM94_09550, partial [Halobacteria archaeon]|nr:hypothetical protein [Halobacteria archaeon]
MFTCCPHCQTCFRITKAQLDVAQGKVRCGHCKEVFNGRQHLRENLAAKEPEPSAPAAPVTEPAPSAAPPSQPEAEKDLTKKTEVDFDLFDLNSIPDSASEEEDWFEEPEEQHDDFVVMESDEWLEDDELEDDVTLNLDMDDYELDEEEEEELPAAPEPDIQTEESDSETASRYEYVEDEMPQEQQDIDQFIAEVNAQLSEAIEVPGKTDPFRSEMDMDVDLMLEPEPESDEPSAPPSSRTDDEFKQAFLANLDSNLALEPKSPQPTPEQTAPEPTPLEPV